MLEHTLDGVECNVKWIAIYFFFFFLNNNIGFITTENILGKASGGGSFDIFLSRFLVECGRRRRKKKKVHR